MKILIKFPTRQRRRQFFSVLNTYYSRLKSDDIDYEFIISCDIDDISMNNIQVINQFKIFPNLTVNFGNNKSKIEAINSDLDGKEFDILLLASDDMIPIKDDYLNIIHKKFEELYPDTDGVLWFNDGYQGNKLNTLCILGKKYYDRFGYIYHPSYKSLWCDNEFMEVANILNKQTYIDEVIIKHEHLVWKGHQWDDMQIKNDVYNNIDRENYMYRKSNNFDLGTT